MTHHLLSTHLLCCSFYNMFFSIPCPQNRTDDMILHVAFAAFLMVSSAIADAGIKEQVAVESDEGVLVLTKDNFDSVVSSSEYLLVKFCE